MKAEAIHPITKNYMHTVVYSFILLWSYAAISKLAHWELSRAEMHKQLFPSYIASILFWLIPLLELGLVYLLLIPKNKLWGIRFSIALLSLFSLYLLTGITRLFGKNPCICAGILPQRSAGEHILFNILFIILGISILVLAHKSRAGKDVVSEPSRKEDNISS
ncbi:MauE/DoxX family redox-associated membrane protein [Sphingobacterium sp. LRF_L2]|uniref:MauE/DoxX family redox-associated membrane protein n=1 Tax=Sphingobacterium sp. LRF_L2 TaxID=3369421 RepID=UPI003F5D87FF